MNLEGTIQEVELERMVVSDTMESSSVNTFLFKPRSSGTHSWRRIAPSTVEERESQVETREKHSAGSFPETRVELRRVKMKSTFNSNFQSSKHLSL